MSELQDVNARQIPALLVAKLKALPAALLLDRINAVSARTGTFLKARLNNAVQIADAGQRVLQSTLGLSPSKPGLIASKGALSHTT